MLVQQNHLSVSSFQKLPLTRIVDHLMELKNSEEEKEYRYFDPKLLRPGDPSGAMPRTRTPFQVTRPLC